MPHRHKPLLSIVTRCCRRPTYLTANIESVMAQTDLDVEQFFIVDYQQQGLAEANASLYRYRDRLEGEYVFMLDDDNYLVNDRFVERLRETVEEHDDPSVVLVRAKRSFDGNSVVPPKKVWRLAWEDGERPRFWIGNGRCVVVRRDLWYAHIGMYNITLKDEFNTGADWHFVGRLIKTGARFIRLNLIASDAQARGWGSKFEDGVGDDWFEKIKARYNINPKHKIRHWE